MRADAWPDCMTAFHCDTNVSCIMCMFPDFAKPFEHAGSKGAWQWRLDMQLQACGCTWAGCMSSNLQQLSRACRHYPHTRTKLCTASSKQLWHVDHLVRASAWASAHVQSSADKTVYQELSLVWLIAVHGNADSHALRHKLTG